jgi:SAM-dependent methyltransferase
MLHRTSRRLKHRSMSEDAESKLRRGPKLDPGGAAFWDARYREAFTPWDAGATPPALASFIARETVPLRVLIPGCGAAYEAGDLAARGHDVVAIDFSAEALERARAVLGARSGLLRQVDFFAGDLGPPFDLVYERAFLCALPRALWPGWSARVATLVRPGGRLAGFFFSGADGRGPPFGLAAGELEGLLEGAFDRIEDAPVDDSIPVFAGRERWQVWRRR